MIINYINVTNSILTKSLNLFEKVTYELLSVMSKCHASDFTGLLSRISVLKHHPCKM